MMQSWDTIEFENTVACVRHEIQLYLKKISTEVTPERDNIGKIVDKKPDGYDYIVERYMRDRLDYYFPGWSWVDGQVSFLGSEWVTVSGNLIIIVPELSRIGINPPIRTFFAVGAARVQFKRGKPHIPENVVDIDKNVKSANSSALKKAINQMCHIGDDVYGKRVDEDSLSSNEEYEESLMLDPARAGEAFSARVQKAKLRWSEVFTVLGVTGFGEITNYALAWDKVNTELIEVKSGGDADIK